MSYNDKQFELARKIWEIRLSAAYLDPKHPKHPEALTKLDAEKSALDKSIHNGMSDLEKYDDLMLKKVLEWKKQEDADALKARDKLIREEKPSEKAQLPATDRKQ